MKCLTLWQPWASLMAFEEKHLETRPRVQAYANFRGVLAIHAGKKSSEALAAMTRDEPFHSALAKHLVPEQDRGRRMYFWQCLPFGAIVAVVVVRSTFSTNDVDEMLSLRGQRLTDRERAFGNYDPDRLVLFTEHTRRLPLPIPFKGRQGLFDLPPSIEAAIRAAVDLSELER